MKAMDGKINSKQLWKTKRQLCPRSRDAPSAMTDAKGNLLTSDKVIQNRALEVFASRLKSNKVVPNLEALEKVVNDLCEIKIKLSKQNKSEGMRV